MSNITSQASSVKDLAMKGQMAETRMIHGRIILSEEAIKQLHLCTDFIPSRASSD